MLLWNLPLSLVAVIAVLAVAIQGDKIVKNDISSAQFEGRSMFGRGIFKRISNFLGFGKENRRPIRHPHIYRRGEYLPYEVKNTLNRRSDSDFDSGIKEVFPKRDFHSERKKVFSKRKHSGHIQGKDFIFMGKRPVVTPMSMSRMSAWKPESSDTAAITVGVGDIVPPSKADKKPFSIFGKRNKKKESTKGKENKSKSFFASKNLSKYREKPKLQPPNEQITKYRRFSKPRRKYPYWKETIIPESQSTSSKQNQNPLFAKKNVNKPKPFIPTKKIHPYKFETSHLDLEDSTEVYDDSLLAENQGPELKFAMPERKSIMRKQKEKDKGLFGNVSSFASNIFSNFLPKSSQSSKKSNRNDLRRSNPPTHLSIPRSTSIISHSSSRKRPSKKFSPNSFDPSPQQGVISLDSFQPIFVPSHSMDRNLPKDLMTPLIVPENRKSNVKVPSQSKPELLDFF